MSFFVVGCSKQQNEHLFTPNDEKSELVWIVQRNVL